MAAWLDPAAVEGKGQEGMKDERFKRLREGLVRTLAESSVSCSFHGPFRPVTFVEPTRGKCFLFCFLSPTGELDP